MRNTRKYGNSYYAKLFLVDMKSYDYVYSVGIDLITNKYMTEYSKCIESSFVTYSEDTYNMIDYKKYLELLKQAFKNNNISEEFFNNLKQKTEPDIETVKNLTECYGRIAKRDIQEMRKRICIPSKLKIGNQHIYRNYNNFCDKNDFAKLYFNRYSKNQGWCVRLVQNEAGYKLSVIYNANKLPDLYEEKKYIKFLAKYSSDVDFYSEYDVYEKQISEWEKKYLIYLLEKEQFYELLALKMKVNKLESIGYTGFCEIRLKYRANKFLLNSEKEIYGYTENDDKEACGIDFYGFIQKCLSIAKQQPELVSTEG